MQVGQRVPGKYVQRYSIKRTDSFEPHAAGVGRRPFPPASADRAAVAVSWLASFNGGPVHIKREIGAPGARENCSGMDEIVAVCVNIEFGGETLANHAEVICANRPNVELSAVGWRPNSLIRLGSSVANQTDWIVTGTKNSTGVELTNDEAYRHWRIIRFVPCGIELNGYSDINVLGRGWCELES